MLETPTVIGIDRALHLYSFTLLCKNKSLEKWSSWYGNQNIKIVFFFFINPGKL